MPNIFCCTKKILKKQINFFQNKKLIIFLLLLLLLLFSCDTNIVFYNENYKFNKNLTYQFNKLKVIPESKKYIYKGILPDILRYSFEKNNLKINLNNLIISQNLLKTNIIQKTNINNNKNIIKNIYSDKPLFLQDNKNKIITDKALNKKSINKVKNEFKTKNANTTNNLLLFDIFIIDNEGDIINNTKDIITFGIVGYITNQNQRQNIFEARTIFKGNKKIRSFPYLQKKADILINEFIKKLKKK